MSPEPLPVESEPALADVQFLEDRLYEFNARQAGVDDGRLLAIFVRNESNEIVAGVSGWTWAGVCEIRLLWVSEALRGQGCGTRLLQAAEKEAAARGSTLVKLGTYSFQAPDFYRRLGYEVHAVLADYPPGHRQFVLTKRLRGS